MQMVAVGVPDVSTQYTIPPRLVQAVLQNRQEFRWFSRKRRACRSANAALRRVYEFIAVAKVCKIISSHGLCTVSGILSPRDLTCPNNQTTFPAVVSAWIINSIIIVKQAHAIIARWPVAVTIGESIISGTIGERGLVMQSCKARQFVKLYPIDVNYILCMKCPVINQGITSALI